MYHISNFTDNDDVKIPDQLGPFTVIEYQRDLSVMPSNAAIAYLDAVINVRKHQVVCDLSKADITLQTGTVQQIAGSVNATTGIKGVDGLFGRAVRRKVTGEGAIKPEYTDDGTMILELTYRHIILLDLTDRNDFIVLDNGLFLTCDSNLKYKAVVRSNPSSTVAGGEGLFNLGVSGSEIPCLESPCPREELVEIALDNDVLKIDGNVAIAWSGSLNFTVERSDKSLIGSTTSGEGLVNVYRGTDKTLPASVAK